MKYAIAAASLLMTLGLLSSRSEAATFNLGTLDPPYSNSATQNSIDLGECDEFCDSINFTTLHSGTVDILYKLTATLGSVPTPTFDGFQLTYNGDGAGDGDGTLTPGQVFTIDNILTLIPDATWDPNNPGRFRTANLQDGSWTLSVNRISVSGIANGVVSIVTPVPAALPLAASAFTALSGLGWLRRRNRPASAEV